MHAFLNQHAGKGYAILRIVVGCLFACHGAQKFFGVLGGQAEAMHDPEGFVAGVVEFGGGLLVAAGLFTRIAAFFACGEMAVAYFKGHAPRGLWPILNHGELAVLYCFVFLYVFFHGSGPWSVDRLIQTHRNET